MDGPRIPSEIVEFYEHDFDEAHRISDGFDALELVRTQEIIRRHLPSGARRVLDVGGATGIHARWLAQDGHEVELIDPMPFHVEAARALATEGLSVTARAGDVRALPCADAEFDAVLLLGPLYHLTERDDRVLAWTEALRVVKPGGLVFAAAVNRFASLFDSLSRGTFADPAFRAIVDRDLHDGQHRNPDRRRSWFTTAYFHHPDEVTAEAEDAGAAIVELLGVEGQAGWMPQLESQWNDAEMRAAILDSARCVESEPTLLGLSAHLLLVARRPRRNAVRIHLDTDLGSDTDDACALAMLLGWPGVEIVGITTTIDPGGIRAGFVHHCLELAGRTDIPVAAGAEVSLTTRETPGGIPNDTRYWPDPVLPRPSRPGDAISLLRSNVEAGATLVAIGPYTNLATLEAIRMGSLGCVPVLLMGGMVRPAAPGLPDWGPEMDWNVQCDTNAASVVFANTTNLTLVAVPPTFKAQLRASHLPRLRAAGRLGDLLARQAEAHAADNGVRDLARAHDALPDDLLNFQYDAVACAVAAGWSGAVIEEIRLSTVSENGVLRFDPDERGRATKVVVDIDAEDFTETWFTAVERAAP